MKYSCQHGSPCLVKDNAAKIATRGKSCSAVISELERDNAALTSDLEQCLDILRNARTYTEEVERVLTAVPNFVAVIKSHLQGLMLLQHGLFLENATVQFRLWHKDREDLLDVFDEDAQKTYDAHQSRVNHIIEQHEGEIEDVHAEWRVTLDSMKREMAELRRQLSSYEHEGKEEDEAKHALLKRAAEMIERKQRVAGRSVATQATQPVSVAASQTADVYFRSAAVQTMGKPMSVKGQSMKMAASAPSSSGKCVRVDDREEEKEKEQHWQPHLVLQMVGEKDQESQTCVPVALPVEEELSATGGKQLTVEGTMPPVHSERVKEEEVRHQQQQQSDATELVRLHLETRRLELECAIEREKVATARSNCSVLVEKLRECSQEILFLRGALDRIESRVFLTTKEVATASAVGVVACEEITLLEHLALDGDEGLNQTSEAGKNLDGAHFVGPASSCFAKEISTVSAYFTQMQKELMATVDQVAQRAVEEEWRATLRSSKNATCERLGMSSSMDVEQPAYGGRSCVDGPPTLQDWMTASKSAHHWSHAFARLLENLRSLMDSVHEKSALLERRGWEKRIVTKVWTDHAKALARVAGAAEELSLHPAATPSSSLLVNVVQSRPLSGRKLRHGLDDTKHHFRFPYAPMKSFGS